MQKFIILIILFMMGCGKAIVPVVPVVPVKPVPILPVGKLTEEVVKTPIREMDLIHQKLRDYTVALVNITNEKGAKVSSSYCTGVWVGEDEILTAAHCVQDESKPWKSPVGDSVNYVVWKEIDPDESVLFHKGTVIYFEDAIDLVLIRAAREKMPTHPMVSLAMELPAIGETVYGVGHPTHKYWTYTTGEISSYRRSPEIGDAIMVNISIWHGNSGGGLFDRDGKLIGICSRLLEIPSMSYYVHLDSIKRFLDEGHLVVSIKEKLGIK